MTPQRKTSRKKAQTPPEAPAAHAKDVPAPRAQEDLPAKEPTAEDALHASIEAVLAGLHAPQNHVEAALVEPMLAETATQPFSAKGWIFELKYDGFRCLAGRKGPSVQLISRTGKDLAPAFPELTLALAALPFGDLVLDGELVVLDDDGKPNLQRLQQRAQRRTPHEVALARAEHPSYLFAFDLLGFEDFDLRPLPLRERKALLQRVLPKAGPLRYVDHLEERGAEMFSQVAALGLEGLMAKKADAPYRSQRSGDWLKLRTSHTADFAVVGYSDLVGDGVGALHLAAYENGTLVYAGKVGSGFTDHLRATLRRSLDATQRPTAPCTGAPRGALHHWSEPSLVAEVSYLTWIDHLRQPVLLRLRDDKRPEDCIRERRVQDLPNLRSPRPLTAKSPERLLTFSHLDKVLWPEDGYTKGDLLAYYRQISSWILPYLADRPLVMARYPDGIHGKTFFQKDAPPHVPEWIRTARLSSGEEGGRALAYLVCDNEETLLYVANLGSIPLHLWSSRLNHLTHPDWCILDLDPKDAPFEHVVTLALAIRALCDELEMPSYPKTSGQKGMHVLLPLNGQSTHADSRSLAELLARLIEAEHPDLASTARALADRQGRVYLDYLQNGLGKTLVAPYSLRPRPGAPVSTPLRWSEVTPRLQPQAFTLKTVPGRLEREGDPMQPLLSKAPLLSQVLVRLEERIARKLRR